jgi:c-di-GMP-binding flagellar brake protein YcgR
MPDPKPARNAAGATPPAPDGGADSCPRLPGGRLDIPLGTQLQIAPEGAGPAFASEFVGSLGLDYLLARLPDQEPARQALIPQARVTVRFPHRSGMCGFETALAGAVEKPVPLLALAFPDEVGRFDLRRHPRVPCFLPARVNCDGVERNALITSLSEGGCRLALAPGDPLDPDRCLPGAGLACNFRLFDFLDALFVPGLVRYARILAGRLSLGVQFASVDQRDREKITGYVDQVLTLHTA